MNEHVVSWLTHAIGNLKLTGQDEITSPDVDPEWSALTAELTAIETRRKEIQEDYADGYFDRAEFRSQMDRPRSREESVREKMNQGPEATGIAWPHIETPEDVLPAWEAESIESQRKMIGAWFRVTILPTETRGTAFDESAIRVESVDPYRLRVAK